MNGSRNHFFSGARLALKEHGAVDRRNHVYLIEHSLESDTGTNQI